MKLFRTSDISVVHYCHSLFAFDLPSVTLARPRVLQNFVRSKIWRYTYVNLIFHCSDCMHVVIICRYL